jgi:hypothetical protein
MEVFSTGNYHTYSEDYGIYMEVGATIETQSTFSLVNPSHFDMRNAIRPYIKSDFKDILSFSMDVGLRQDKLDSRPFLDNDFTIPGEGFYMDFLSGGSGSDVIPMDAFYSGFDLHPEISISLLQGMLELRWGAVNRDWGVGTNNLQLSSQAAPFEAIEGHLHLTEWLRYSFITGSLGGFALPDGIEGNDAFFAQTLHSNEFNNNYSAKRVEVDLPWNITFGIHESNIWIKRFEIGYLNPFTILMLQQSLLGDTDNMLAGIDFQWRLPGILRLYGSFATTEMNAISPSVFFTHYRNIMAFQGGVDIDLPVGRFSKITFQYTKLEPFFYTHYPITEKEFVGYEEVVTSSPEDTDIPTEETNTYLRPQYSTKVIQTSYVNKGFTLGYPLHPNSDEFLATTRIGISPTLNTFLTVKYQRRSSQYGYAIDMSVNERYRGMSGLVEPKDFIENLFEKNLSVEIGATKSFIDFPITIYGSYRLGAVVDKELNTVVDFNHYPTGSWSSPSFDHVVKIGVTIYQ